MDPKLQYSTAIIKQWFIQKNDHTIQQVYQFDQKFDCLGKGQFGKVVKAKKIGTTDHYVAIKIMKKNKIKDPEKLINQVNILRNLDHPNVVRLFEIFQSPDKLYLVMEYCQGGQLFQRTLQNTRLSEDEAKMIFRNVVQAVAYCHSRNICHRDLKPQNILLLNKNPDSPIKIIDFGISAAFNSKEGMKTKAGTCYYISPEVLTGRYDQLCDIWSLGVILYFLVSGVPPFYGQSQYQILQMVKKGIYTYDIQQFQGVSEQVKDLINKCLQPRQNRIKPQQMIIHPWLKQVTKFEGHLRLSRSLFDRFRKCSKLKIIILTYMATQLNSTQCLKYSKMFKLHDKNGDGYLQYSQLFRLLKTSGIENTEQIQAFVYRLDTQKLGKITYNEFLAATIRPQIYTNKQKIKDAFLLFDKKNKGFIGIDDFKVVLKGIEISQIQWKRLIGDANTKKPNMIDFEQFEKIMSR